MQQKNVEGAPVSKICRYMTLTLSSPNDLLQKLGGNFAPKKKEKKKELKLKN